MTELELLTGTSDIVDTAREVGALLLRYDAPAVLIDSLHIATINVVTVIRNSQFDEAIYRELSAVTKEGIAWILTHVEVVA